MFTGSSNLFVDGGNQSAEQWIHTVTLANLKPNTNYFYRFLDRPIKNLQIITLCIQACDKCLESLNRSRTAPFLDSRRDSRTKWSKFKDKFWLIIYNSDHILGSNSEQWATDLSDYIPPKVKLETKKKNCVILGSFHTKCTLKIPHLSDFLKILSSSSFGYKILTCKFWKRSDHF